MARSDAKIRIRGENDTKRAFSQVNRSLQKLGNAARRMGQVMGLALAGAGAGLVAMTKKTLTAQDRIGKLSQQIGVSTEALSEMQFAAEQTGVSGETLSAGLEVMSKRLGEVAIKGSGAAAPAIEKLGLNVEALVKMKPDEQFEAIAKAMGGLSSQSERNAVTANIFSRANQGLVNTLALGGEGMDEMRQKAQELGRSLSRDQTDKAAEANDAMNELTSALTGVANELTTELAPAIAEVARALTRTLPDAIDTTISWYEKLREKTKILFDSMIQSAKGWAFAISLLPGEMGKSAKETLIELHKFENAFRSSELDRSIQKMVDRNTELFDSFKEGGPLIIDITEGITNYGEAAGVASKETEKVAKEFNDFADALQDILPTAGTRFEKLADTLRRVGIETRNASHELSDSFKDAIAEVESKLEQHKETQKRIWQNLVDGVQDAWVGFFEDTFQGKGLDSVKDFLGRVKDLFFRLIAEIAAKWTAAKIFGGDFSLSLGGGGGVIDLAKAGASLKGGLSKIGGLLKGGGAVEAGTGATATGGFSAAALQAGAVAAFAVIAPEVLRAIRGPSSRDEALKDLQRAGPGVAGGLGLQATAGDKFGFGAGANAGFAADFAKRQMGAANAGTIGEGLAVFKGMDLEGTIKLLDEAQKEFESLKKSAQSALQLGQKESIKVGQALQDGVIDQTELADLGFIKLGERISNTKSGVEVMGDLAVEKFDAIINAVDKGTFRLEALRGETNLNAREMQFLGQQGLLAAGHVESGFNAATGAIRSFGSQSAAALREIEGAARSAGGAVAGIGGEGPGGAAARDANLTQQLRNDAQRRANQGGR